MDHINLSFHTLLMESQQRLKFSYTLDGVPTAYVWKAVVLYERQITSHPISGIVK